MTAEKVPYLYITGASFSGSTLLAFLLNAHPRMVSVSEVCGVLPHELIEGLDTYRCSCGQKLLECPFYRDLEQRVRILGSSFDLRDWKNHFQLSDSRLLQILLTRPMRWSWVETLRNAAVALVPGVRAKRGEIAHRNLHFACATLELSGKQLFVDAQKNAARVRFLSAIEELDLYVIHLVRDARAGAASFMKHNARNDAARAAHLWLNANLTSDYVSRCVPKSRWMRLRYDELCADHQGVIDRISDFTGVERGTIPKDFYATPHHIVGNKMRLASSAEIRPDHSWRQRLSDKQIEIVGRVAGAANRKYGFEWP